MTPRPPFVSPEDQAMLDALSTGATLAEAAEVGGYVSRGGVKNRLQRLYELSGMNNPASLIAWCFRKGYLT